MLTLESFGQRIRTMRMEKNLTQQQLADMMFVSRKTIGNWESGNRLPDISMLSRLASHLGVETYELLDEMYGPDNPPVVIAVEDDPAVLKSLVHVLSDTLPDAQVFGFEALSESLRFASANRIAAAFVDIDLSGDSGIVLAKMLMSIAPRTNIIFLSSHPEAFTAAWNLHASGFVLSPLTPDKVRQEIENLRYPVRGLS